MTYLLLNSRVKEHIENPGYYLNGQSEDVRQALDNLLLTLSHRGPLWEDPKTNNPQGIFIPEYRAHIVTGTLKSTISKNPEEGIFAYLSIPSDNARFFATKSGEDGNLLFEVPDITGTNEFVIQTNHTIDSMYEITIENPFSEIYSDFNIPYFDLEDSMKHFIEKASRNMQIQNAYLKYRPPTSTIPDIDSLSFFEPDERYFLDDYTRFPVMEEVMREYIAGVYLRHNQDGYHFKVLQYDRMETFKENPLILLDGIPVFDADEIIALDPLHIKKIETVRKKFLKGVLNCNGIVSFSTYKGDLEGYQLNEKAQVIEYEGVQPIRKYLNPDYDKISEGNDRIPDYRNVLYWNPHFNTDEKGEAILEFYTSDDVGEYEIRVEGISSNGKFVSASTYIQVR
jgi:hypothetical protein